MTVNISAVNDAPRTITFAQPSMLVEGSLGGVVVGQATGSDPEDGVAVTYSLRNEDGSPYTGPLAINASTGIVTVGTGANGDTIDFETSEGGTLEFVVRVTDLTGLFRDLAVSVNIADLTESSLQAIEGYIANARVFVDANDNGTFDSGEYSVFTDAVGGFKIVGNHGNHDIILLGGNGAVDTATGLAFNGILRAPAGSTVLSPITTLIAALASDTVSVATATAQVVAALSLPNVDYTTFDPIAASLGSDTNGDAVFAAGVQVYNTIVQTASLLSGAGANAGAAADAVVQALAQQIQSAAQSASTVGLASAAVLTNVIQTAASTTATDVSTTASGAANVIAGTNDIIQDAVDDPGTTGSDLLKAVTGAATVAQGEAATALQQAGQSGSTTAAESNYTGGNLQTEVATATAAVDENAVAGPNGDNALVGTADADILDGQGGNDELFGGGGKDLLIGGPGDDTLYGDTLVASQASRVMGIDRADYSNAAGPINVQLAAGTVTGDGTDTLVSVEFVTGTNSGDTFDATGFSATSTNGGGVGYTFNTGIGAVGNTNQFEGKGGNDTITGNGATRVSYQSATAGVTVNLSTNSATGDVSVGTDTITGGVVAVRGSAHNNSLTGQNTGNNTESFDGLGGDDFIDGNGGFDRVRYDLESPGAMGIAVNLGAGTVTGRDAAATAVVGNDTVRSIESVRGSNSADIYDASTFTATSTNGGGNGDQGNFNEFEGLAGNDTVIGNFNTRLAYYSATSGDRGDTDRLRHRHRQRRRLGRPRQLQQCRLRARLELRRRVHRLQQRLEQFRDLRRLGRQRPDRRRRRARPGALRQQQRRRVGRPARHSRHGVRHGGRHRHGA